MVLLVLLYKALIIPSLHFNLDNDMTIGWQHFLMMGVNAESQGTYSVDDYNFTESFKSNRERNAADLEEAKRRVKELGIKGMIRHLNRKQMVNYGDGTFFWGGEGNFFAGDPEWANNRFSGFVRSLIRPEGEWYAKLASFEQCIWSGILFFMLFTIFYKDRLLSISENENIVLVMILSVIGLTIFELLFESRARYLFCYAPIYCILGALGVGNVFDFFDKA